MRPEVRACWAAGRLLASLQAASRTAVFLEVTGASGSSLALTMKRHFTGGLPVLAAAAAHAPVQPHQDEDRILLKGLVFHGYHGALPEENVLGQKFVVDAVLHTDLRRAGQTDDLQHTINYAAVYRDIKTVMEGRPHQLLESVAERVASNILAGYPTVSAVQLSIQKPHVAVEGVVEGLGVQITRRREQQQQQQQQQQEHG